MLRDVKANLIYEAESYQIIGACFEVYREKGCGFLEPVYQECMEIELRLRGIPYTAQRPLALEYKGTPLQSKYQPDFVCYDKIIVELKAVNELADEFRAQVQNYLKATSFRLGLLINFGHYPKVELERIAAERGRYAPTKLNQKATAEYTKYAEGDTSSGAPGV
jgi:GxxExxY protein